MNRPIAVLCWAAAAYLTTATIGRIVDALPEPSRPLPPPPPRLTHFETADGRPIRAKIHR